VGHLLQLAQKYASFRVKLTKRLREQESDNTKLRKFLTDKVLEIEVT
jgi:hypothetical protein